ncbi:MAG: sulfite oxidase-like oxidoreductase [Chloroflexota bacterium]|nr:sulfite oxidase-like oxidoreductase [Chloroflexota bacterium]
MPPGQRLTEQWPVLTYGATPRVELRDWSLRVWGEVEREAEWNWEQFRALGTEERTNDIHCVTHWSRFDNTWEGVLIATILEHVRPTPGAAAVMFHSYGGYTTNVSLDDLAQDDHAMIAFSHDGEPIPAVHGGPLRGVVPSLYFWKSAKWVHGMEILPMDRPGFWEMYGYHLRGDPWAEERYS